MKKRILVAGAVLLIAALILLPVLALNIHAVLSQDEQLISLSPAAGWEGVVTVQQIRKLYLLLTGTMILSLLWAVISSSSLKYRSKMMQITPDIETPCSAGQGQFGTARWASEREFCRFFTLCDIVSREELVKLLEEGRKDKEGIDEAQSQHRR